ncbi:DUF3422 family protein [Jannaschia sp. W003]|uniref:DUF3422 family protein n=1 Tax=Jannaschia sp. W003 TaxID=2867012 RepID=UPI0021A53D9B|nr:DUF3422 domain-containing protein [Jannaschia sp. W003]UWQ20041.1 DUF3422 domain-containing protein [Jannaschia sp. W003]
MSLRDHPLRQQLANELHARPFPTLEAPCRAAFLALAPERDGAGRDRAAERAHLLALLDRFGADHPPPDATHFFGPLGRHRLKWESHTEFETYTLFTDGVADRPFDPASFDAFPADWLAAAPGCRIASALIRVEGPAPEAEVAAKLADWFVPESLAAAEVLGGSATVASDFRIDAGGHVRIAVFAADGTGAQRVGRIVQRLCEIEVYRTLAMLALPEARRLGAEATRLDGALSGVIESLRAGEAETEGALDGLLAIGSELETMLARSAFRFGAQEAYEALVNQRVSVLRETRLGGRQTLAEFMMRRFDPAMRTCRSTQARLEALAERARNAGDLLSTRVNVERAAQNAALLRSMDARAEAALRLQRTVEGLSVVAISYYAVSLVGYLLYPVAGRLGVPKEMLLAGAVVPVVLLVWLGLHGVRKRME